MYAKPRVERFGSLGQLTLFKPDTGFDFATPHMPEDCTEPAEPGAENNAFCQDGGGGRS